MQNIYELSNPENFNALKQLVESKPKGFKQMLEAKGRKREPGTKPKYAYLLQWMNDILPLRAKDLHTKEKCWWILHGLTDFPECHVCGKTIFSNQFTNIVHGYRTYCCIACAYKSDEFSKHISESQKIALENDKDFYKKKCAKSKRTRIDRNGGTYFSQQSLKKRKDTISKDPNFWKRRDKKTKETKIKNGHSPTWNNPEKTRQTRLKNHNGKWEDEHTFLCRKQTSQRKYGTDDPSQSDIVKQHKAQAFERKHGIGVKCWFQTPESRVYMKAIDEQRKQKELATKRKNGTFNTSKQEEDAYNLLHFMYPHLIRQYKSEVYPFCCDFYDPMSNAYIECNFSWTHGGHWFDATNENDIAKAEFMRSKHSKYYDNAIETWTVRDVKKKEYAEKNELNYLVFWNLEEVRKYVLDELQKRI